MYEYSSLDDKEGLANMKFKAPLFDGKRKDEFLTHKMVYVCSKDFLREYNIFYSTHQDSKSS